MTGVRTSELGHRESHQLGSPSGHVSNDVCDYAASVPEVSSPPSLLTPSLSLSGHHYPFLSSRLQSLSLSSTPHRKAW